MQIKPKIRPYGTYMKAGVWITPVGNYNILHYDCPTDEEIKQRVQDTIKETLAEDGFEDNCFLCQVMKEASYDIVYYCQVWCYECTKTNICVNFDPDSYKEQENLN